MKKAAWIIVFSAGVTILDTIFKIYAIKRLPEEGVRFHFPIGFALHKNPGIAFDILVPLPVVIALTCGIVALLGKVFYDNWRKKPLLSAFAAMIILGALNNMLDRLINGFTTDYIILFSRSAINLSDILIILGTILLIGYSETKESR